jgi:hypothetical protein
LSLSGDKYGAGEEKFQKTEAFLGGPTRGGRCGSFFSNDGRRVS